MIILSIAAGRLLSVKFTLEEKIIDGQKVYLWMMFLIFFLVMGLRAPSVGTDTLLYGQLYRTIGSYNSLLDALENPQLQSAPAYILISRFLNWFSSDPQILSIATGLYISAFLFLFILKTSKDIPLSVFSWIGLALFFSSMNTNRQYMAMVTLLYGLFCLFEKFKNLKGWLLILLALGLHQTSFVAIAIVMSGMFLATKVKDNRLIIIISSAAGIILSFLLPVGINFFNMLFPRYARYTVGYSAIFDFLGQGRVIILYVFLFSLCLLVLFGKKSDNDDKVDNFCQKIFPAVICMTIFGIFNNDIILANRIVSYFIALYICIIPYVLNRYSGVSRIYLRAGIILALSIYAGIAMWEGISGSTPYRFFWQ